MEINAIPHKCTEPQTTSRWGALSTTEECLVFLHTLGLHCTDLMLLAGHYSETESHRASGAAGRYFAVGVGDVAWEKQTQKQSQVMAMT